MAELKVKIGADLSNLQKGLTQAAGIVTSSSNQISGATSTAEKSFTTLNNTKFTFGSNFASASRQLANEAAKSSAALGGSMKKGANEAAFALTNLGRVAQDTPFGFIGIQNNLNPLLESFQQLKVQTGSTGAALKAMAGQLIGPAGLGLALSLVTAGIVAYQQYQQNANSATANAKKSADDYVSSLSQLQQVQVRGAMAAQDELTNVRLLFKAYQDSTLPLKARKEAYSELQSQYPDYFKNIKFEREASEATTTAYNNLTSAILATARARAAQDLITKNSTRQLENEQKILDLQKEQQKNTKEANATIKQSGSYNPYGATSGVGATLSVGQKNAELQREINNLKTDSNRLTLKNLELEKSVNVELTKGAKLTGSVGSSAGGNSSTDAKRETNPFLGIDLKAPVMLPEQFKKDINEIEIKFKSIKVDLFEDITKQFDDSQRKFLDSIDGIGNSVIDSLGSYFQSLGEAMASGDFSNFGQDILQAFAGFLGQLGQLFIKQGTAEIAFGVAKNLILPGSGASNIAGGIGMTLAGAAISVGSGLISGSGSSSVDGGSDYQKIPQFAKGVTNFSGGLAIVGEQGPELVNLPTGSDVIPNHKIGQFTPGDGQNINLTGKLGVSLGQLVVELKRAEKVMGRTY